MSFDKLKGKMTEARISQAKMAEYLEISPQSLNSKLNGRNSFTLEEVIKISEILHLKDPVDIFLSHLSQICNIERRDSQCKD